MQVMDGVDNMEEKTWVISKKGEKFRAVVIIIIVTFISVGTYLYISGPGIFEIMGMIFYFSILFIDLLVFFIFKAADNWDNPKILTIKNKTIITEEKFPDGEIQRQEVPIDGIYKITIKRTLTLIKYKLPDGRKFIWRFIRPGYAREDREKLKEALEEILKKVDRNKVEIVGRR